MGKESIQIIKDNIYEIEGLLELLALRPEKNRELIPLIRTRLELSLSMLGNCESKKELSDKDEACSTQVQCDEKCQEYTEDKEGPIQERLSEAAEIDEENSKEEGLIYEEYKEPTKTPPVFCLNDKFRFKRAIFSGSDIDFNEAMQHVANLPDYEAAEEYFFGDKGLDPDDEDVMDFMEVLKTYFGV